LPGAPNAAPHVKIATESPSKPTSYKKPLLIAGAVALVGVIIAIIIVSVLKLWPGQSSSSSAATVGSASCPTTTPSAPSTMCIGTSDGFPSSAPFLTPGTKASFEWPWVGCGEVSLTNPESCTNPWDRSVIASVGSQYDPATGVPAPDGYQYSVLVDSYAYSVQWLLPYQGTDLTYTLDFWYSLNSGTGTSPSCTVALNTTVLWNAVMVDNNAWNHVTGLQATVNHLITNPYIYALVVNCAGFAQGDVVVMDAFSISPS